MKIWTGSKQGRPGCWGRGQSGQLLASWPAPSLQVETCNQCGNMFCSNHQLSYSLHQVEGSGWIGAASGGWEGAGEKEQPERGLSERGNNPGSGARGQIKGAGRAKEGERERARGGGRQGWPGTECVGRENLFCNFSQPHPYCMHLVKKKNTFRWYNLCYRVG